VDELPEPVTPGRSWLCMKLWSIAASAAAYERPLDSSAIRNAYFLGSSNSESVLEGSFRKS